MALFFTRQATVADAARPLLKNAHLAAAKTEPEASARAAEDASVIEQGAQPTFSVIRFSCAVIFVIVLFGLYYLSVHDPKMANHSDELFNLFVSLTSGLTGLLVGEASSK